jgi:hypothetical protein
MAATYGSLNQLDRQAENVRKAYELREKVSERERAALHRGKLQLEGDRRSGEGVSGIRAVAADLPKRLFPLPHISDLNLRN